MSILSGLAEVGRIFADKAKARSVSEKAPSDIAFTVTSPIEQGGVSSIEVHATHPAVAAFEYGSGIHAKESPGKYPIDPVSKNFLAFLWPKVNGDPSFRRLPDGRVLLSHVEHPGVEARPFMKPTLQENQEEFKRILGQAFRVEIMKDTAEVEIIEIK
jgi:hypothetical protein